MNAKTLLGASMVGMMALAAGCNPMVSGPSLPANALSGVKGSIQLGSSAKLNQQDELEIQSFVAEQPSVVMVRATDPDNTLLGYTNPYYGTYPLSDSKNFIRVKVDVKKLREISASPAKVTVGLYDAQLRSIGQLQEITL